MVTPLLIVRESLELHAFRASTILDLCYLLRIISGLNSGNCGKNHFVFEWSASGTYVAHTFKNSQCISSLPRVSFSFTFSISDKRKCMYVFRRIVWSEGKNEAIQVHPKGAKSCDWLTLFFSNFLTVHISCLHSFGQLRYLLFDLKHIAENLLI